MQRLRKIKEFKFRASLKRFPSVCKKSKEGEHTYELTIPPYMLQLLKDKRMSVSEYYRLQDESTEKSNWKIQLRHWKCVHCGHLDMDSEQRHKKKIRNNLYEN